MFAIQLALVVLAASTVAPALCHPKKLFASIQEAMKKMSPDTCDMLSRLRNAQPLIEDRMADTHKLVLERRAIKKLLSRKLKVE